ncbi:MAG: response regulator, partial [Gemmatimonadetes bacterium]|nr:response regulator [Gemmatimonadota bacterium]
WYLVAQDTARIERGDVSALVVFFVTTSVNVGLLYQAGALWFRAPAVIPRRTAAWFVAGFMTYVVADLLLERESYLNTYTGGSYLEVFYNFASLALVLGADAARRRPAAAAPADTPRRADIVPVIATLIALVPLALESRHLDLQHTALHGVALGLAVLLLMVQWRQRLARDEIAALSDRRIGLEQQLWQAQKMDAIGRLAGGIAHDFNNILAAISSHAQLLRSADGPPSGREIDEIEYATQRAAALTHRLLAFSRTDSPRVGAVPVSAVVRSMEPMLRRLLAAPVRFDVQLADDDACVALGDGQLEQVLLNLAVNARDAMPEGGTLRIATRRVRVAAGARDPSGLPPGEWAVLEVHDTGHGMDDGVRARLFEPFFTTKPRGQGTGLGLVTVAGIADAANGHVFVDSAPGRGTTMTVVLPLVDAPARDAVGTPAPAPRPHEPGRSTILLVDDEASVRRALGIYLSRHQFTVLEAEHGRAALTTLAERDWQVDLVITDVEMPEMSGLDLAREIRARAPALPLLYMSGYVDGRRGSEPDAEFSAADVLTKPFDLAYLLERVRGALSGPPPRAG